MQVWTKSSYENIFQDSHIPWTIFDAGYELVMAKNERESFQIVLRSEDSFTIRSVTFSDLICGEERIAASNVSYGFVEYVFSHDNTMYVAEKALLRKAPAWFPDPISNDRSIEVTARTTQPVWITVYVPKDAVPGMYQGCATVHTSQGDFKVSYSVEVCDVAIPDPNEAAFTYSHHQQIAGSWWLPKEQDTIYNIYGYERWSDSWWEVVKDIAEKMGTHRHNCLFVNLQQILLDGGTTLDEEGTYHFNWSKMDEYIYFFMKHGSIKWLQGNYLTSIEYEDYDYMTFVLVRDEKGNTLLSQAHYDSEIAENWMRQFLPALQNYLEERGWLKMWEQHVGDEPRNDAQRTKFDFIYKQVRKYAPKLMLGDAVFLMDFADHLVKTGVDIIIPEEDVYEQNKEFFQDAAEKGVKVFVYNCCGPTDTWLNRFIDKPVWEMRSLAWLLYSWNVNYYSHWGFNFWNNWTQMEFMTVDEEESKGDHYTIYPDPHSNKVRSSIRYEANRDAAEDFELLTILGRRDPEYAKELVARIVRDSHSDYTKDIDVMIKTRKELVRAAAGKERQEGTT